MPPDVMTVASPSLEPQDALLELIESNKGEGSETVSVSFVTHPLASVTATVYIPADRPVAVAVVCAPGSFHM
jgi:hypothetical protein